MNSLPQANRSQRFGVLDWIEWIGNKLPDPVTLFLIGALVVMALSHVAYLGSWTVVEELPRQVDGGVEWIETGVTYSAQSLLTRDGLDWAIRSMVENFINFPPLGVVLVGMLGIGVAERTGLIAALLKGFMLLMPDRFLTPAIVFIGIMSSMAIDAGYVVLPPLAAALYLASGRSPLAGIAAVFAGVSAGFGANLFITSLDPMLAEFSNIGAQVIDPEYRLNPACNWWFMIVSAIVMTFVGWAVTSWFVERRLQRKPPEEGGPDPNSEIGLDDHKLTAEEMRGMKAAGRTFALFFVILILSIQIPGAPLYTYRITDPDNHDRIRIAERVSIAELDESVEYRVKLDENTALVPSDRPFPRWVSAIVPLLFMSFFFPSVAYGVSVGKLRNDRDVAKLMVQAIAAMAPVIVLAFTAAQFIEYFRYSGLDRMLAISGGKLLSQADMSVPLLITAFIGLTMLFNLFIGSMSAKYALFGPVFIPMFMMVGISPELTQVAYRIGDSVTNIITPLNSYMVILLVFMQKYVPKGGIGTLIALMFPYTVAFSIVWTLMLIAWMALGVPLGPDGGLTYTPPPAP